MAGRGRLDHRPWRARAGEHAAGDRRHAAAARRPPGARAGLHAGGRYAWQPIDGGLEPRVLAARVRRRSTRHRPVAGDRRHADAGDRRAAGGVPLSPGEPRADRAVPPEPGRGVRRQLQLLRVGAPEAGHDRRPGQCRHRAAHSRHSRSLPDATRVQPADVRRGAPRPEPPSPGSRRRGRHRLDSLGPARRGRHRAARRVRQHREPVPGARRGAAAGARHPIRARGQPRSGDRRVAGGSLHAQHGRRPARPRPHLRWHPPARGAQPLPASAPGRDCGGPGRSALRRRGVVRRGPLVRPDPNREVRQPTSSHHAQGGRPRIERWTRAASRTPCAGGGAGGARPRAPGGIGPDDSHLSGHARRATRLHGSARNLHDAHRHPRDGREGSPPGRGHPRADPAAHRSHPRRHLRWPRLVDADGRYDEPRSGVGRGQARARRTDAAASPLQVGDAKFLRDDWRSTRGRPRSDVGRPAHAERGGCRQRVGRP